MASLAQYSPHPARVRVRLKGQVQGVGFRPFLWSLARLHHISGWVKNDGEGVLMEAEGGALGAFLAAITARPPPLARIDAMALERHLPARGGNGFHILPSGKSARRATMIGADTGVCADCLGELFDPQDRRHLHPFINCTHCGPRYTITRALPYDRASTAMADFAMCPACEKDYADPASRRFHAQPIACPACGPRLSMAPHEMARRLAAGEILAIKGLGGFHLACDATNGAAVARLRARKQRDGKPFAVMVANIASAWRYAFLTRGEERLLQSAERPILLCRRRARAGLAKGVCEGLATIGLMLPYTPLHYLIFHAAAGAPQGGAWRHAPLDLALVMTSANPGGEPLVIDNEEARRRLAGIADAIVDHDRAILLRCDDTVMRLAGKSPIVLRRARGLAPRAIKLAHAVPPVLAVGGFLKATICVTRDDEAFLSPHIGDLDNTATIAAFRDSVRGMLDFLGVAPQAVARDLHPDFPSSRFAETLGLPVLAVQHHHAHIAALAAEYRLDGPLIGLALDGFGLGADGAAAWGGELLRLDGAAMRRLGHLFPLPQPGGDKAARAPWRMAAAALHALRRTAEITARFKGYGDAALITAMLERGVNTPQTSSCGRLFDAACGLLGVAPLARYEGEAAMRLEALVRRPRVLAGGWRISDGVLDLRPLLAALIDCGPRAGAELFHGTLAAALVDWAAPAVKAVGGARILLSGGCLANGVLGRALASGFKARGIAALLPRQAPPNDGGLSLGQAWVCAQHWQAEGTPCA
ncbi:MAG: carbamoyltransferase HypF [Pseudomonadota bacterium]